MKSDRAIVCLLGAALFAATMLSPARGQEEDDGERPEVNATYDVVYAERGDEKLLADIYVPEGEGPFPGVLVVHGGAWVMGNRLQLGNVSRKLSRSGYSAVAINYRLAPTNRFPAQIEDCKTAVRWMRTNADKYKIDPQRLGGWGYSAGAQLVGLLGTTEASDGLEGPDATPDSPSTRLQAVVAGGAPCDFRSAPEDSLRLAFWLGGTRREKPEQYRLASPMEFLTRDDPPVFFYHGERDRLVDIAGPEAMMAELEKLDIPTKMFVLPRASHIGTMASGEPINEGIAFLNEHLKSAEGESNIREVKLNLPDPENGVTKNGTP